MASELGPDPKSAHPGEVRLGIDGGDDRAVLSAQPPENEINALAGNRRGDKHSDKSRLQRRLGQVPASWTTSTDVADLPPVQPQEILINDSSHTKGRIGEVEDLVARHVVGSEEPRPDQPLHVLGDCDAMVL